MKIHQTTEEFLQKQTEANLASLKALRLLQSWGALSLVLEVSDERMGEKLYELKCQTDDFIQEHT